MIRANGCPNRKYPDPNGPLIYCEGQTDCVGDWIPHAFLVDRQGYVVDPTLRHPAEHRYIGVPLRVEWVNECIVQTGEYSDVLAPFATSLTEKELLERVIEPFPGPRKR